MPLEQEVIVNMSVVLTVETACARVVMKKAKMPRRRAVERIVCVCVCDFRVTLKTIRGIVRKRVWEFDVIVVD